MSCGGVVKGEEALNGKSHTFFKTFPYIFLYTSENHQFNCFVFFLLKHKTG